MPDEYGNFKGYALSAKAGATWEKIFGEGANPPPADFTLKQRLAERHEREKPLYDRLGDSATQRR